MNSAAMKRLQDLRTEHPEWNPWLGVVGEVLEAAANPHWEEFVPSLPRHAQRMPLLAEATIIIPIDFLRQWLKHLIYTAAASGTPEMATLQAAQKSDVEPVHLFRAALARNSRKLERVALDCGADAKAFQSVADLLPIPLLQACQRMWDQEKNASWNQSYCPLCGAWPAFAEVRGIERARYLRCGRCGVEWQAHALRCTFCNNNDHEQLVSLVPENNASARAIESCKRCTGYLKSINRLEGVDALAVMLEDLASVDLDIAAVEQGYRRPPSLGCAINPTIGYSKEPARRIFSWRH
jgi:FdhE protein